MISYKKNYQTILGLIFLITIVTFQLWETLYYRQKNHQTLVSDRKRDNYNYDIKKSFEEYDLKNTF